MANKVLSRIFLVLFLLLSFNIFLPTKIFADTVYHASTENVRPSSCVDLNSPSDCQNTIDNDLNTSSDFGSYKFTVPANTFNLPSDSTNIQLCFSLNFADITSKVYAFGPYFVGPPSQGFQFNISGKQFINCLSVSSDNIAAINTADADYWLWLWSGRYGFKDHLSEVSLYYTYDTMTGPSFVPNRAPAIGFGPTDSAVNLGNNYSTGATFVDQDSSSWTATVDYGDGGGVQPVNLNGQTIILSHQYQNVGTYELVLAITDEQGNTGTRIANITVQSRTYKNISTPDVAPSSCVNLWNSSDCQNTIDNDLSSTGTLFTGNGSYQYLIPANTFEIPADAINLKVCASLNYADYVSPVYAFDGYFDNPPNQGVQPSSGGILQFTYCRPIYNDQISIINTTDTYYWLWVWAGDRDSHLANFRIHYLYDSDTPLFNTPKGENVVIQPVDSDTNSAPVKVTFNTVSQAGNTSLTIKGTGQPPPYGFRLGSPPLYYELQTTAVFDQALVCINYGGTSLDSNNQKENNLKLFHLENNSWTNQTTSLDTNANIICGNVSSFSPFAIFDPDSPPVTGQINAPTNPVLANTKVEANVSFTDPDITDHHTAVWDWGDFATSSGTVNENAGSGTVTGNHTYNNPGTYTIKVTVTDEFNKSSESLFQYLVVYNPEVGYVIGGGLIDSPAGAFALNPRLTGKAIFLFASKYKNAANIPSGQTDFQLKAANFNFHSTGYDWLVVAGATAQYEGSGTVNGNGDYKFLLTAKDDQSKGIKKKDLLRIKIWNKANNKVVYDNQMGNPDNASATRVISEGSIVVHQ